jgi:glutaminyl-peptide cyclotransferase
MRPLLLLLLTILAACGRNDARQGALLRLTEGLDAPPFSAEAAFAHIRTQVGFGPRVPGSAGHARQLEWMTAFVRARADTVELQPFTHETAAGERLELTNVFARFRPALRDRILVAAHWDTRPTADHDPDPARRGEPIAGANDGASGVAVLLELADVLSRHSPPIGVDLLFTDGEDYGPDPGDMFLGALHFARNLPAGYRPLYGVLVDMVADADPVFPTEGYSREHAPEVVARIWQVAEELGLERYFPRRRGPWIMDDHVALNQAGIRTANIIDFDFGPGNAYWHTHADSLQNVSELGPGVVGRVLVALIYMGG